VRIRTTTGHGASPLPVMNDNRNDRKRTAITLVGIGGGR
jgi:hypothetical protein